MLEREEVNKCRQDGNVRVVASWGLRPQTPHTSVRCFTLAVLSLDAPMPNSSVREPRAELWTVRVVAS